MSLFELYGGRRSPVKVTWMEVCQRLDSRPRLLRSSTSAVDPSGTCSLPIGSAYPKRWTAQPKGSHEMQRRTHDSTPCLP